MADWASLINSPPPSILPSLCESDGLILASNDLRAQTRISEVLSQLPTADLAFQDPKIGHKLQCADSTFFTAKSAFLPAEKSKNSSTAAQNGFLDNFIDKNEETWWFRFFTSLLNFSPGKYHKFKLCPDDLIALYSNTRDLKTAPVRCVAWHPHVAKVALAMKDDTVQIALTSSNIKPLLKHKKQKQVACMAWRPFSASELAIGCASGVLIWTVDPLSVVARPSAACVSLLSDELKNHQPVTSLAWNPQGTLLLSCCASDTTMYIWNTASEVNVPLKRIGGGGVHLASWSPLGTAVIAATTSTAFRIWKTSNWQPERWSIMSGHMNNICWSPCASTVLFTTSEESQIYCLRLSGSDGGGEDIQSAGAAVPVMDLSKASIALEDQDIVIGGQVLAMRWDPSGERLVVSFHDSNLVALFGTRITPAGISISPLGFIRGDTEEAPTTLEFAKHFKGGALLSIVWSSGRFQHFPMFFMTSVQLGQDLALTAQCLSNTSPTVEFTPRIFSSPAI